MNFAHLAHLAFFAVCGGIALGSIVNDFRALAAPHERSNHAGRE